MLIVTFDESSKSRTQVQFWYKRFKKCDTGCPSTSVTDKNIEAVKKIILDKRRIFIRKVADDVGRSFGLCQAIFTDILGHEMCGSEDCSKIAKF